MSNADGSYELLLLHRRLVFEFDEGEARALAESALYSHSATEPFQVPSCKDMKTSHLLVPSIHFHDSKSR